MKVIIEEENDDEEPSRTNVVSLERERPIS